MRFNSMDREVEVKKDYSQYIIIAIVLAFVSAFFLNILGKLVVVVFNLAVEYWYVAIIIVLMIIFLRRRKRRK